MKSFQELLDTFNPASPIGFYHLTSLIIIIGGIWFSIWLGNQWYQNYKNNRN